MARRRIPLTPWEGRLRPDPPDPAWSIQRLDDWAGLEPFRAWSVTHQDNGTWRAAATETDIEVAAAVADSPAKARAELERAILASIMGGA